MKNIIIITIIILLAVVGFFVFQKEPVEIEPEPDYYESLPETVSFNVYFLKIENEQEEFVAVERTVSYTPAVARASITDLLKGPSYNEENLFTAIPSGTQLLDIYIMDNIAYAEFNEKLSEGVAGSATVLAIRGQIEKTLEQFESIDGVVILINGQSEDILQP